MIQCKCGMGHRGWEQPQKCNIELSRRAREGAQVAAKPVTVTVKAKDSVTVTPSRMAELRKRKAAQGLIAITVWAHPDDHQAIKAHAQQLAGAR